MNDPTEETIRTYNRIAEDYILTMTPEVWAWETASIEAFAEMLTDARVLVPGCGDGRHSRYLSGLGLDVTSFDLSEGMLAIARRQDPVGRYLKLDLREMDQLNRAFGGIFATGCLYHLRKSEFPAAIQVCRGLLTDSGIFYVTMKGGTGEVMEPKPLPGYPGGEKAIEKLAGNRFYAYYTREELGRHFAGFEIVREEKAGPIGQGFEMWLRKTGVSE